MATAGKGSDGLRASASEATGLQVAPLSAETSSRRAPAVARCQRRYRVTGVPAGERGAGAAARMAPALKMSKLAPLTVGPVRPCDVQPRPTPETAVPVSSCE